MKKTNVFLGVSLLGTLALPGSAKEAPTRQPNIIYILADDMGRAEMNCYGQQLIETPNMDKLAKSGMLFTNSYSGTAVSAPSRCILMTGLHSGHAYIRGNDEMAERGNVWSHAAMYADSTLEGQRNVPASTVMIPALLKKGGYTTACIGKWGLGYPGSVSTPNKMGFDFFYGYNCQRQAHTYYPLFLYRNEHHEYTENQLQPIPGTKLSPGADPYDERSYDKYTQKQYSPDLIYPEILKFVENSKDKPFMLMWTTPLPHVPLQAPEKLVKYYVDKFGDEAPYDGKQGYFPCRYLREGGIRTPMLVSWPTKVKPGTSSDILCSFWDMMPTFCDIAGVPCDTRTDGISILPELLGKSQPKHDYLYWEFPESGGQKAVRLGKWKAFIGDIEKGNRNIELYDLDLDPREQTNMSKYHPEIIKQVKEIMEKEHE